MIQKLSTEKEVFQISLVTLVQIEKFKEILQKRQSFAHTVFTGFVWEKIAMSLILTFMSP